MKRNEAEKPGVEKSELLRLGCYRAEERRETQQAERLGAQRSLVREAF